MTSTRSRSASSRRPSTASSKPTPSTTRPRGSTTSRAPRSSRETRPPRRALWASHSATVRNSRLGVRIKAPEFAGIRVTGQLEMDFLGNQPAVAYPNANGAITEQSVSFANAELSRTPHHRRGWETPIVDFLFGQYWALFGWQPYFHPNTDDFQGVPLEVYSRRPQLRVSKTVKTDPVDLRDRRRGAEPDPARLRGAGDAGGAARPPSTSGRARSRTAPPAPRSSRR